ncbi:ABC transporter ATP-binding protein [Methylobacterium terricola]|uniref:ABC transporter ATP-binding protein n=1 Tax=Methylobacterium terricola TaxID=2583531 RepID=A0A5C4L8M2_9HYPH|nr:ATP-binding cassette domain-containing protein [Methylobacterium terricola]TNC07214.1 ABC transporter ATP-binding protein [Methylobacterium terricola]
MPTSPEPIPLLSATGLVKVFHAGGRAVRAVDGVDLSLAAGEVLGVVGESGSGKSTLARLVLRLTEPSAGRIAFDGRDITALDGEAMRRLRRDMQIVFQNPHSALNGRRTVGEAVAEPLRVQGVARGAALDARVDRLLDQVSLPRAFRHRYPHELSGGQKQRVCIARALALEPRFLVLDEPTSALDVSVQAQILDVLGELRRELSLTYLFISHNLAVVRYLCDRVMVMREGRVVEQGPVAALFAAPAEAYTRTLLDSVPRLPRP